MKKRVYNFAAGPAQLPEEVLKEAKKEMMNYKGTGMSVMEMSHRSKMYQDIIDSARNDLKELLNVPDNYAVLNLIALGGKGEKKPAYTEKDFNLNKIHYEYFE